MIQITDLVRKFGEKEVLHGINLDIADGEVFGFLGPNGSGKTTTIRIMTGVLKPTSGNVFYDERNILQHPIEIKSQLGYAPAEPQMYPKLKGREMMELTCALWKVPAAEWKTKIDELFDIFEMTESQYELIEAYSTGMKGKLSLMCALVHDPKYLIIDEIASGMDPKALKTTAEFVKRLQSKGKTVFLSTHILELADALCERCAIIKEGEIVATGKIENLKKEADADLESLFLQLTGGPEIEKIVSYLGGD